MYISRFATRVTDTVGFNMRDLCGAIPHLNSIVLSYRGIFCNVKPSTLYLKVIQYRHNYVASVCSASLQIKTQRVCAGSKHVNTQAVAGRAYFPSYKTCITLRSSVFWDITELLENWSVGSEFEGGRMYTAAWSSPKHTHFLTQGNRKNLYPICFPS
jgi:hypothetical protein